MSNNTGSGRLAGKWPAVVKSYDGPSRTCEVDIPGITDGAESPLVAEIEYPIGDKSRHATMTEIEILPGDKVWVEFIQGDPRYPLISGWRNPKSGNAVDYRRYHHANFEVLTDNLMCLLSQNEGRIEATNGVQLDTGGNSQSRASGKIKQKSSDNYEITSDKEVIVQANGGSIILRSSTGTLII